MEAGVWRRLFCWVGAARRLMLVANSWLGGFVGAVKAAGELPHSKMVLVTQGVNDRDAGVYFDGLMVEDGWVIAPLADRGKRGLDEQGIAGDYLQRFDRARGGDDGVKFHAALVMNLDGEGRVPGLDASDELSHLLEFTNRPTNNDGRGFHRGSRAGMGTRGSIAAGRAGTRGEAGDGVSKRVFVFRGGSLVVGDDRGGNIMWHAKTTGRRSMHAIPRRRGGRSAISNRSVGRNWRRDLERDALAFAEKWKKNQRDESDALQEDGYCYCALLDATSALFGLRIAFDQTTAE